jgi:hypothetical protein
MPKFSRTGKPLCCRCRKLATSRQAGYDFTDASGEKQTFYVYHCTEHAHEHDEPFPLQAHPEPKHEPTMYKSWEEAQPALDRGETVRIEMQPSEINPTLVQLAQDLQDREQLARWIQDNA